MSVQDLQHRVEAERADSPDDRSGATYNLVMRGLEAGDTDEKILKAASSDTATMAKYGARTDA